jgi:hypothetical protein
MHKIKLILVICIAVTAMGVPAAYAIEFIWRTKTAELKAGSSEPFTVIKTNKKFVIASRRGGEAIEVECKNLEVQAEETSDIEGGRPGVGVARLELTECKPNLPATCETVNLNGIITFPRSPVEIVESEEGGKVLLLFRPRGGTFFPLNLKGKGCSVCTSVTGSILAELTPEKEENVKKVIKFPAATSAYRNSEGQLKSTGLILSTNSESVSFKGEGEIELKSKAEFGAH